MIRIFLNYISSDRKTIKPKIILKVYRNSIENNSIEIIQSFKCIKSDNHFLNKIKSIANSNEDKALISYLEFLHISSSDDLSVIESIANNLRLNEKKYFKEVSLLDLVLQNKVKEVFKFSETSLFSESVKNLKAILLRKELSKEKIFIPFTKFEDITGFSYESEEDMFVELLDLTGVEYKIDYEKMHLVFSYYADKISKEQVSELQSRIDVIIKKIELIKANN